MAHIAVYIEDASLHAAAKAKAATERRSLKEVVSELLRGWVGQESGSVTGDSARHQRTGTRDRAATHKRNGVKR